MWNLPRAPELLALDSDLIVWAGMLDDLARITDPFARTVKGVFYSVSRDAATSRPRGFLLIAYFGPRGSINASVLNEAFVPHDLRSIRVS